MTPHIDIFLSKKMSSKLKICLPTRAVFLSGNNFVSRINSSVTRDIFLSRTNVFMARDIFLSRNYVCLQEPFFCLETMSAHN